MRSPLQLHSSTLCRENRHRLHGSEWLDSVPVQVHLQKPAVGQGLKAVVCWPPLFHGFDKLAPGKGNPMYAVFWLLHGQVRMCLGPRMFPFQIRSPHSLWWAHFFERIFPWSRPDMYFSLLMTHVCHRGYMVNLTAVSVPRGKVMRFLAYRTRGICADRLQAWGFPSEVH